MNKFCKFIVLLFNPETLILILIILLSMLLFEKKAESKDTGVYLLQISNPEKSYVRSLGSSFKVGPKTLITAAHVCLALYGPLPSYAARNGLKLQIVDVSLHPEPGIDACIVRTKEHIPGHTFELANEAVSLDTTVTAIGYPNAREPASHMPSEVIFWLVDDAAPEKVKYITTFGLIVPGMSGGPLLNPEGKVVGINAAVSFTEIRSVFQSAAYVVPWVKAQGVR